MYLHHHLKLFYDDSVSGYKKNINMSFLAYVEEYECNILTPYRDILSLIRLVIQSLNDSCNYTIGIYSRFQKLLQPFAVWTVYCNTTTITPVICHVLSVSRAVHNDITLSLIMHRVGTTILVILLRTLSCFFSSFEYLFPGLRLPPIFDNFDIIKVSLLITTINRTLSTIIAWHYYAIL